MQDQSQPAHLEIALDEPRIARGSVDSYSVRVTVRWRAPETTPPIIATLNDLPEPVDLVKVVRTNGEVELVPRSWRGIRFGREGSTLFEMARRTPGGLGLVPQVRDAVEYAEHLLEAYHHNLDDYDAEDKAELVRRTIERMNKISSSIAILERHLEFAAPGRKAVRPLRNPTRDVRAHC